MGFLFSICSPGDELDPIQRTQRQPIDPNAPRSIRIVLCGTATVGKTALITVYSKGHFNENHEPTVLDIFRGEKELEGRPLEIEVIDTSGDDMLGAHRTLVYDNADCFMLCVAADNRASFERINYFKNEIKLKCPNVPILLVATKYDLREECENPVRKDELEEEKIRHGF